MLTFLNTPHFAFFSFYTLALLVLAIAVLFLAVGVLILVLRQRNQRYRLIPRGYGGFPRYGTLPS